MWQQGWKKGRNLELNEPQTIIWDRYILALRRENICLSEGEDELIWDGDPGGTYTPKEGYVQLSIALTQQEEKWWWRRLWKIKIPAKGKLLVWSILENKVPTWDILQKKQFHGPSWCSLCRMQEETIDHLFMCCPFTLSVWMEASILNPDVGSWRGATFEATLKEWIKPTTPKYLKALPILAAWGIWIARNNTIFWDIPQSSLRVATTSLSILDHLNLGKTTGQGTSRAPLEPWELWWLQYPSVHPLNRLWRR
jgi:hypothetical protein